MQIAAFIRDLAIILIAIEAIAVGVFLIILIWEVRSLAKMLKEQVLPILKSADDTARTVRGTATFVSDNVVTPVAKVSGFVAGVRQAARVLIGRDH